MRSALNVNGTRCHSTATVCAAVKSLARTILLAVTVTGPSQRNRISTLPTTALLLSLALIVTVSTVAFTTPISEKKKVLQRAFIVEKIQRRRRVLFNPR